VDTTSVAILGLAQTAVGGLVGYAIKAARQIRDDASKKLEELHVDLSTKLDNIHDEVKLTNGKVRMLEAATAATDAATREMRISTTEVRTRCTGRFDSLDKDVRELRDITRDIANNPEGAR